MSSNFKLLESQLKSKFCDIQNLEMTIQISPRICLAEANFLIRKEEPLVECFYAVVLLVWPPWHQIWAVCSQRTKRTWHPYTRGRLSGLCTCEMCSGQNLPTTKGNFARFLWWLTITSLLCQTTVTPVVVIHLTDADACFDTPSHSGEITKLTEDRKVQSVGLKHSHLALGLSATLVL